MDSPQKVEDEVLEKRGGIFVPGCTMAMMLGFVGKPLEDQHDKGDDLDDNGKEKDRRIELCLRMDGIQDVGNVAKRNARPEYNLCDGSDLVLKEDGEEIANAEDKSEEGDTEQDDVMEAKGRIESKKQSEDDVDDENEEC